jgi:pilus assembly protein CpaC
VAGLLSENSRNAVDKYPLLGDIPVLGNLFKSSDYQKDQTELVILITAHLAKPLDKKAIILPTDLGHEPDDMDSSSITSRMTGAARDGRAVRQRREPRR